MVLHQLIRLFILFLFFYSQHFFITYTTCSGMNVLREVELQKYICYIYDDINKSNLLEKIMYMQKQESFIFNLVQYYYLDMRVLPVKHVFSHPHLFIDCYNNIYKNILINLQFSEHNYNNEFQFITKNLLNGVDKNQLIKIKLHIYEQQFLIQDFQKWRNYNNYIIQNYQNLNNYSNLIFKKY